MLKNSLVLGIAGGFALTAIGAFLCFLSSSPDHAGSMENSQAALEENGLKRDGRMAAGASCSPPADSLTYGHRIEPGARESTRASDAPVLTAKSDSRSNHSSANAVSIFQMTAARLEAGEDGENHMTQSLPLQPRAPDAEPVLPQIFFLGDRDDDTFGNQDAKIRVPLAHFDPDPAIDWTDQAVAGLAGLRDRFARQVEASRLDPANPEYAKQWRAAQPGNDDTYRLMFGYQAFMAKQLDVERHEVEANQDRSSPAAN